ncbi:MAG: hypothetical protein M3247_00105 [Thermoproteota archaeon]|nr:hypothetical protein [Thermoproteota archaeon]
MHSRVSGSVDGGFETINRGIAGSNPVLRTVLCLILEICLQNCIQIGLVSMDLYTNSRFLYTSARTFVYKDIEEELTIPSRRMAFSVYD